MWRELAHRHTDTKTKRMTLVIRSALWSCGEGGIGYYADQGLLRLTPFPSARRRGPCKPTAQKAASRLFCFLYLCLQVNLRQRYKKQKVSISRYLFASWSCGEGGIRTPGASQLNGFQDRRNRPLCHLSKGQKYSIFFKPPNIFENIFYASNTTPLATHY